MMGLGAIVVMSLVVGLTSLLCALLVVWRRRATAEVERGSLAQRGLARRALLLLVLPFLVLFVVLATGWCFNQINTTNEPWFG